MCSSVGEGSIVPTVWPFVLQHSFLEAARYVECFKASVNKPPEELQPEVAIATAEKDQLALVTDFLTALRVVSRSDAAVILSRFGVGHLSSFPLLSMTIPIQRVTNLPRITYFSG